MKKKLVYSVLFVLAISLVFVSIALAQDEEPLFRLDIRNHTDQQVTVVLSGPGGASFYALSVSAGTDKVFTVKEGVYSHTTFACGKSGAGTLTVDKQLRLVFTPCSDAPPNAGEPSIEKIFLTDTPEGINWLYQFE